MAGGEVGHDCCKWHRLALAAPANKQQPCCGPVATLPAGRVPESSLPGRYIGHMLDKGARRQFARQIHEALARRLPSLLAQHSQGHQLHERVHADHQVGLVLVKGLRHLLGHKQGRDGLRGHMDETRLLPIVAYSPHEAVPNHEGVGLWQLIEGIGRVIRPHINIVHLPPTDNHQLDAADA